MLTFAAHALILASPYSPQPAVETPGIGYPGPQHAIPTIHFIPTYVSDRGGWHDVAGAFTHKGVHHIWQGTGWNHAVSHDLVKWSTAPHGPKAVHETYKGMDSETDPCSGFVTLDKDGDGSIDYSELTKLLEDEKPSWFQTAGAQNLTKTSQWAVSGSEHSFMKRREFPGRFPIH